MDNCCSSPAAVDHTKRGGDQNDAVSSQSLSEETTATKRQHFTTSIESPTLPSSSNAPPLPTLPFEIVIEILCRLPVKPLLRLRTACKSWDSLISDPKFARKHLHRSPTDFTRHHLIFGRTNDSDELLLGASPLLSVLKADAVVPSTQLQHPLNDRNCSNFIYGSCDGMVCLAIDQGFALVWNPSTGRFKKLPALESLDGFYSILYGFGYDHLADSYKVVALLRYEEKGVLSSPEDFKSQVMVHTLGTDSWRRIQEEFPSGFISGRSLPFVSGTLNWLVQTDYTNYIIVSLDSGKECHRELSPPPKPNCDKWNLELMVLKDCLCIVSDTDFSKCYDVWLMKEYGNEESWTNLFRWHQRSWINTLHISENDEVLLESQKVERDGDIVPRLYVHNCRDGTTSPMKKNKIRTPMVYVESLISPY